VCHRMATLHAPSVGGVVYLLHGLPPVVNGSTVSQGPLFGREQAGQIDRVGSFLPKRAARRTSSRTSGGGSHRLLAAAARTATRTLPASLEPLAERLSTPEDRSMTLPN
jgi:hypothetical protein